VATRVCWKDMLAAKVLLNRLGGRQTFLGIGHVAIRGLVGTSLMVVKVLLELAWWSLRSCYVCLIIAFCHCLV
jgi:hypothetical protein